MYGITSAREWVAVAKYTSTSTRTKVNANLYALKSDVYLNGGPQNQNDPGIVPDGIYYFQVTNPNGDLLLSTDCAVCREVTVLHGRIVGPAQAAIDAGCAHAAGTFNPDNKQTPVQLIAYND